MYTAKMASPRHFSSLLLLLSLPYILHILLSAVPAESSSGPISITRILQKAGQYTYFIRLLNQTQAAVQIDNQVYNSYNGITVFAPTDNAFKNLPAGTINRLTVQQQVQLVLYHICPQFYSLADLQRVSNPVRTQASRQDGSIYGLYFSATANQVNVFDGNIAVPINIALRKDFPLAVYQLDSVFLPMEFSKSKPPAPPIHGNRSGGKSGGDGGIAVPPSMRYPAGKGAGSRAVAPSTGNHAGKGAWSPAVAPSPGNNVGNGAGSPAVAAASGNLARNSARKMNPVGLGFGSSFGLLCIGILAKLFI